MNARRERFYRRVTVFLTCLFIAYLSVPARSAEEEKLVIIEHYPLEYCAAITGLSSVILLGEGEAELGAKHSASLEWFLSTEGLDYDVVDLVELKLEDLLEKTKFNAEDIVVGGTECHNAHVAYLAQENADE